MKKKITPFELAERLASQAQIEKSQAESFVRKFFELVGNGLLEDKYVKIKSFGTFKLVSVGERESININTGERFQISGHTKVSFSPDAALKELVNQPFAHFEAVDLNDETDTEELNTVDSAEPLEPDTDVLDDAEEDETETTDVDGIENGASFNTENSSTSDEKAQALSEQEQESELADTEIINLSEPSAPSALSNKNSESVVPEVESASEITQQSQTSVESTDNKLPAEGIKTETSHVHHEDDAVEEETSNDNEHLQDTSTVESVVNEEQPSSSTVAVPLEEEEIEVSSPQPVTTPSDEVPAQERTSSSIAGYVYEEVPSPRKRNAWKYVALAFCALVLMGLCYFAGYFRVLCPECLFTDVPEAPIAPEVQSQTSSKSGKALPPAKADTAAASQKKEKPQTATASQSSQTSNQSTSSGSTPSAATTSQSNAQSEKAPVAKTEPQATPEKPQTVKHTVKAGENLTRIVRRHYGSDAYVNKVVNHNHLKNADNVAVGTVIELPPFK